MYPPRNLTLATPNCSRNSSESPRGSAKLLAMTSPESQKSIAIILAAACACSAACCPAAAYSRKRAAELRTRDWIVQVLEDRFQSDVELADFHVNVFPTMTSKRRRTVTSLPQPAASAPPLIRIEKFSFDLGFLGIFRTPHRIRRIHLQRMVITVPPSEHGMPAPPATAHGPA